ncbi:hypothetical protein [Bacillus coahuilensis]|uniref:hypothetical protein n=1 Tax=Bacillus coahuilensis TaxID=408580 RepID=UPI0001851306|nr:hypothetical protein [Bacillus coahuilensis]
MYIQQIQNRNRYLFSVIAYVFILCCISAILFYPVNYFNLHFSLTNYFLLYIGVFMGSGALFHRFFLHIEMFVMPEAKNQNEDLWDWVALVGYNLIGSPVGGFVIYMLTDSFSLGIRTSIVMLIGSVAWYITIDSLRTELKRKKKKNLENNEKIFVDEAGNKHLKFKL